MNTVVLIMIIALTSRFDAASSTTFVEFSSHKSCYEAGSAIAAQVVHKKGEVIAWGCFPK